MPKNRADPVKQLKSDEYSVKPEGQKIYILRNERPVGCFSKNKANHPCWYRCKKYK
jgi:hypothetical protein